MTFFPKIKINFSELTPSNYVGVDNLISNRGGRSDSGCVPKSGNHVQFKKRDILIGNIRPYLKKIWFADRDGGTNGDVLVIRLNHNDRTVNARYLYHVLSSDYFFDYNVQHSKGAKMPRGDKDAIMDYLIPVPAVEDQNKIVSILDEFESFLNDISVGLPAEISARRKQYECYRDRLFRFEEAHP
ncbi:MAG: restriction endonuclease subunit S [Candidatus Methanoplasma sp.]|jgi:type I restriction enzyme S subunit|nr:restriction endonuclease subunit S [Candidatus Methanoplasma sp.]